MSKTSNLLQSYEDFARSIYQKTGINDEIEIIVPKAHYMKLLNEMTQDPFHLSVADTCPVELKIMSSVLTFRISYKYFP